MSATLTPPRSGSYDRAARTRAQRRTGRYRGVEVYIPAEVLAEAGFDPDAPVWYRLVGHRRSARAGTVLVSLYREP